MLYRCLVALAALPVFAQAPPYTNPKPVERAIQHMAPQVAPVAPAQPALRLPQTGPFGRKGVAIVLHQNLSAAPVCSVPLTNVLKGTQSIGPMPKIKPQRRTAPMPLVKLPAPPCPE